MEDQAYLGPRRAVAEPVTDVVAQVQSMLAVGEQQRKGAFPVLATSALDPGRQPKEPFSGTPSK